MSEMIPYQTTKSTNVTRSLSLIPANTFSLSAKYTIHIIHSNGDHCQTWIAKRYSYLKGPTV